MKPTSILVLVAVAAVAGCSFLCIPAGNCVSNCDCGAGFVCAADAGVCVPGKNLGAQCTTSGTVSATGGTSSGLIGGFTSGSTGGIGSTTSGSASSTSGSTPCIDTSSCCGKNWANGESACESLSLGSTVPGSLYVTTNSVTPGIYQLNPGSPPSTSLVAQSSLQSNLTALGVMPGSPTGFVYGLDTPSPSIAAYINGTETQYSVFGDDAEGAVTGIAFLPGSNLVAVGTTFGPYAYAFPPGSGMPTSSWANVNDNPTGSFSFPVGQMVVTGASQKTLTTASALGATLVASNGNVCFSQGCISPPGSNGGSVFTGAAVDFTTGTTYIVGAFTDTNGNSDGVVAALDGSNNCAWVEAGNGSACTAGTLPFACSGGCHTDGSLAQNPLLQAGFLGGALYVTELGMGGGGAIATYSQTAGLAPILQDQTYFSMAVGP